MSSAASSASAEFESFLSTPYHFPSAARDSSPPPPLPYRLAHSNSHGRYFVASRALDAGVSIIEESAYSFVLLEDYESEYCSICLSQADKQTINKCQKCQIVYYCSNCSSSHHSIHPLICSPLSIISSLASRFHVDRDLLKLVLHIAAKRKIESESQSASIAAESGSCVTADPSQPKFLHVSQLVSNLKSFPSEWRVCVGNAAKALLDSYPNCGIKNSNELVELAGRINSNSFGILGNQSRTIGLGVFIRCSILNSSCQPNCSFVGSEGHGGILTMRTIQPIPEGSELCDSYIDCYQSRLNRQIELLKTKHFLCRCSRCCEPIERSVDRFLEGIQCPKCNESAAPESTATASTAKPWSLSSYYGDTGRWIVFRGHVKEYLSDSDHKLYSCLTCQTKYKSSEVKRLNSPLDGMISRAFQLKSERRYTECRQLIESIRQRYIGSFIHPLHESLQPLNVLLLNCLNYERRYTHAMRIVYEIIENLDRIYGATNNETSDFVMAAAEIAKNWLVENQSHAVPSNGNQEDVDSSVPFASIVGTDYRALYRRFAERAVKDRIILCGEQHSRTMKARAVLEEADRMYSGGQQAAEEELDPDDID